VKQRQDVMEVRAKQQHVSSTNKEVFSLDSNCIKTAEMMCV